MEARRAPVMGSITLVALAAASAILLVRVGDRDVAFCRGVMNGLVKGRLSVRSQIAWEQLQALGVDLGTVYTQLPNAFEQSRFEEGFVTQSAPGFRMAGGDWAGFRRWRVAGRNGTERVIAVDYGPASRTLLLTITVDGPRKLTAIQWQNAD